MIKKLIVKTISVVLIIPGFIYILFFHLEKDFAHAWFWATVAGIGNTMSLFCSPKRKITGGFKELGVFDWLIIMFFSLVALFLPIADNVVIRIFRSLCAFMGFAGCLLFQHRITTILKKKP